MKEFIRGERARLSELAAINHIWQVEVSVDAPFFVVDFCCLGLDEAGQVVDDCYLVSYNQPNSPKDAIQMDNASNTGAVFMIYLEQLPPAIRRVVLTATVHKPEMPGGLLGAAFSLFGPTLEMGEGHLILSTPAKEAGYFTFSGENFGEESTLILGEFYWRDEWRFVAAGQPLKGDLDDFLRTLTDGPLPVPIPSSRPATSSVVAPPRPPRITSPATSPSFTTNQANTATSPKPHIPVITASTTPVPLPAPSQPVAQSISPQQDIVESVVSNQSPLAAFPQSLPAGGKLQDLIDAVTPNSTLTLVGGEYEGPIIINKALKLEGQGSALWSRSGPVVTITHPEVSLHNFDIEVTVTADALDATGIALKIGTPSSQIELESVQVRGRISGLGAEDGKWELPRSLELGEFAARAENQYFFAISVPTKVQLTSTVEGVSLLPDELEAGLHRVTLIVSDVISEALIMGFIEVRSVTLIARIRLTGISTSGIDPLHDVPL